MSLADEIDIFHGPPLQVLSDCLRGCIVAAPGHELIVADFSAIEARGLAWLAGAERLLDVFRTGADIYCVAAEDIYGYPINKKEHPAERQIGKVTILACGYQGSVGAFQSMARNYLVTVPDKQALKIVKAWRAANDEIVTYWRACETAAIEAVKRKGEIVAAGPIGREVRYLVRGSFLLCRLPSGRALSYPYPRLVPYLWIKRDGGIDEDGEPVVENKRIPASDLGRWLRHGWQQNGEPSAGLHYRYQEAGRFVEGPTYGGSLVENITQAVCRDLLAEAMLRVEAAGYPVVLHVHDELVAEVPEGTGDVHEFERIMAEAPAWADGFPIAAEGWRGRRYRK